MMTEKRTSVTWIELILMAILVLSGLALKSLASQAVERELIASAPWMGVSVNLAKAEERLARAEAERQAIRNRWAEKRVAYLEDKLGIQELLARYPGFRPDEGTEEPPLQAQTDYIVLEARLESCGDFLRGFEGRLDELTILVQELRLEVERATRAVAVAMGKEEQRREKESLRRALMYTGAGVPMLLLLVWTLVFLASAGRPEVRFRRVASGALAILTILIGAEFIALAVSILVAAVIVVPALVRISMRSSA